ncbi:MAG TPA: YwiC-like family protein [Acidobacteriota bacterium]|nr:YwiC-like family protein [Acidobacteriota bacterium]
MKEKNGPLRRMPIPGEHGAWGLLYGSFGVAWLAGGGFDHRALLLLLSFTGLFLAHEPLVKLIRTRRGSVDEAKRRRWKRWLLVYLLAGLPPAIFLLVADRLWFLLPLGAAAGILFGLHLTLSVQRRDRTLAGELLGVVALTLTAPAALYAFTGSLDTRILQIWGVNLLFFASGIFFVRMKVSEFIKTESRRSRLIQCIVYHLFLAAALILFVARESLPPAAALAFAPILFRGFWGAAFRESKLNLKRLGYTEVAYTVFYVLVAGWGLRP